MKTCAIISEYNPFHYGHQYQIEQAKKQANIDVMIAIMSGNFVQRGEPAIIDKWTRAKCALENGIDVVFELPYIFASQSASRFAFGGVQLAKLAKVDYLSFGSECGNLENLKEIAETSINPDHLKMIMDQGVSYPKAYSLLTKQMAPNDILAVSYLKALGDCQITPILIQRTSGYLSSQLHHHASAYAIRQGLKNHQDIDFTTPMAKILNDAPLIYPEMLYPYFRQFILLTPRHQLQSYFMISEGIEKLMADACLDCDTYEAFIEKCTNYRYTSNRIRRIMLQIMHQCTKQEANLLQQQFSLRLLGFNSRGRQWLKMAKEKDIPMISKFSQLSEIEKQMAYRSCLLYSSCFKQPYRSDLLKKEISGAFML